jgi:hypothetical protein
VVRYRLVGGRGARGRLETGNERQHGQYRLHAHAIRPKPANRNPAR